VPSAERPEPWFHFDLRFNQSESAAVEYPARIAAPFSTIRSDVDDLARLRPAAGQVEETGGQIGLGELGSVNQFPTQFVEQFRSPVHGRKVRSESEE
jgi:hypothetical protein